MAEGRQIAQEMSARSSGSVGGWLFTGYADTEPDPPKPSTPSIGKKPGVTHNCEEAARFARRMRGNINDVMGMGQDYEDTSKTDGRPTSARRTRTEEAQTYLERSHGSDMKGVFNHSRPDTINVESQPEPEIAPEPVMEAPAAAPAEPPAPAEPEPAPVVSPSENGSVKEGSSKADDSSTKLDIQTDPTPPPSPLKEPEPDHVNTPREDARMHARRNNVGTLGNMMSGTDNPDMRPRSGRTQYKRPDSMSGILYGDSEPTQSNSSPRRVRPEGEKNFQQHRISNIF